MQTSPKFRCAVLSAVKHDYVARGVASHPRFELVGRRRRSAAFPIGPTSATSNSPTPFAFPTSATSSGPCASSTSQVAIVSPEAERHCDLSICAHRRPASTSSRTSRWRPAGPTPTGWWRRSSRAGVQVPDVEPQLPAGRAARPASRSPPGRSASRTRSTSISTSPRTPARRKERRQPGYPPLDWQAHQIAAHVDGSDGGLGTRADGRAGDRGHLSARLHADADRGRGAARLRPDRGPLPSTQRRQRRRRPGQRHARNGRRPGRHRWPSAGSAPPAIPAAARSSCTSSAAAAGWSSAKRGPRSASTTATSRPKKPAQRRVAAEQRLPPGRGLRPGHRHRRRHDPRRPRQPGDFRHGRGGAQNRRSAGRW